MLEYKYQKERMLEINTIVRKYFKKYGGKHNNLSDWKSKTRTFNAVWQRK